MYGLADQRLLHETFGTELADRAGEEGLFSLNVCRADDLHALSQCVQRLRDRKKERSAKADSASGSAGAGDRLLAQLTDRLGWRYAFDRAVREPAKQSVTALTHRDDEFARVDYSRALDRRPLAIAASRAGSSPGPSARVIGTAVHLVISSLDLSRPVTRDTVERTRDSLIAQGTVTPVVGAAIDMEAILSFFESEVGLVVLDKASTVWREWPFTWGLPVSGVEEMVVVQGIIDMLVRTSKGLLVIDFKTDRVSDGQVRERADTYRGQLELYGQAASTILACPVAARWLYFLRPRKTVAV